MSHSARQKPLKPMSAYEEPPSREEETGIRGCCEHGVPMMCECKQCDKSEGAGAVGSGTLVMPHCPDCEKGDKPRLLDSDGVLCELSGQPGRWSHGYDIYWWDCPIKQPAAKVRHNNRI